MKDHIALIAIAQFWACFIGALGPAKTMDVMAVTRFGPVLALRMNNKPLERPLQRQLLRPMNVTVFRVEDELGLLSLPECGESAFGLPLRRLECRTILSTSEELAAAMAYRQAVSIHRHKRLIALRAPKSIIDNEAKLHAIVERLLPVGSLHGNSLFAINNLCECWLLCVDAITNSAISDEETADVE